MLVGYPRGTVERRLLLMLSAFFDGSGPGHSNGRYVMAGFVSFCPTWGDIAEEWRKILDTRPAIPKFKMSLARNQEWRESIGITQTQMDDKIEQLSALVQPPRTLFSVICSISQPEFRMIVTETEAQGNKHLRSILGKFTFKTAYALLFHNAISATLNKIRSLGIVGDQVDFVFDRENELFDNANILLKRTRRFFDPESYTMLGDAIQRDDDKVLPLQSADLIAALSKDQCNDPENMDLRNKIVKISGTGDYNATFHIREHHIRKLIAATLTPMPEGWKPPFDYGMSL